MRLEVDGAWSLRTEELTDAAGRHDCIVDAPYSKGRAVTIEVKRFAQMKKGEKRGAGVPYFRRGYKGACTPDLKEI